jgi:hypothetical protein
MAGSASDDRELGISYLGGRSVICVDRHATASGSALCWRVKPTKLAAVALANKTARIDYAHGAARQPRRR